MHLHLVGGLGRNARAFLENLVLHALGRHLHRGIQDVLREELGLFIEGLLRGGLFVGFLLLLHQEQEILPGGLQRGVRHEHLAAGIDFILDGGHDQIHLERHVDVRDIPAKDHAERIAVAIDGAVERNLLFRLGGGGGRNRGRVRRGGGILVSSAGKEGGTRDSDRRKS